MSNSLRLFVGFILGVLLSMVIETAMLPNTNVRPEAKVPEICRVGEQVLMTTAPRAELYVCESHWVRK